MRSSGKNWHKCKCVCQAGKKANGNAQEEEEEEETCTTIAGWNAVNLAWNSGSGGGGGGKLLAAHVKFMQMSIRAKRQTKE